MYPELFNRSSLKEVLLQGSSALFKNPRKGGKGLKKGYVQNTDLHLGLRKPKIPLAPALKKRADEMGWSPNDSFKDMPSVAN